jgi:hypothetical protein
MMHVPLCLSGTNCQDYDAGHRASFCHFDICMAGAHCPDSTPAHRTTFSHMACPPTFAGRILSGGRTISLDHASVAAAAAAAADERASQVPSLPPCGAGLFCGMRSTEHDGRLSHPPPLCEMGSLCTEVSKPDHTAVRTHVCRARGACPGNTEVRICCMCVFRYSQSS